MSKSTITSRFVGLICLGLLLTTSSLVSAASMGEYRVWAVLGARAAVEAASMTGHQPGTAGAIALTNAGYAEIRGHSTEGCLDGVTEMTGVSRGSKTLVELQSSFDAPLWFFFYHKETGMGAYLQVNGAAAMELLEGADALSLGQIVNANVTTPASRLFTKMAAERIDAEHLYANAEEYSEKFGDKIFGGNEFRIVTTANALNEDIPMSFLRSIEFHDHYCPGVTSGVMMVEYVKENFPKESPKDAYNVISVSPWCKEDALQVMLNATPGKRAYFTTFATEADKEKWADEAKDAATIFFRENGEGGWDGLLLGFSFDIAQEMHEFPDYGNTILNKLYMDLWYLDHLDQPELFVSEIKRFELSEGEAPADWARPGVDPMEKLGLVKE